MYSPKFNQVANRAVLIEAMQAYSFAILFGPQSTPENPAPLVATHLPLVVKDEGEHGLIEGHFAKANPHWKPLAGRETLVVFPGPHSYVSPSHYVEELSVPTWNYIAVHAYGTLQLIEDDTGKEALLARPDSEPRAGLCGTLVYMPDGFRRTCWPASSASASPSPVSKVNSKSARTAPQGRLNVHTAQAGGTPTNRPSPPGWTGWGYKDSVHDGLRHSPLDFPIRTGS